MCDDLAMKIGAYQVRFEIGVCDAEIVFEYVPVSA